jgi:hypothetical protein
MYRNQRHAQARISDDSIIRDVMTETRLLIFHAGTSRICVSNIVIEQRPFTFSSIGLGHGSFQRWEPFLHCSKQTDRINRRGNCSAKNSIHTVSVVENLTSASP